MPSYTCETCNLLINTGTPTNIKRHEKTLKHKKRLKLRETIPDDVKFKLGYSYCPHCKIQVRNEEYYNHRLLKKHLINSGDYVFIKIEKEENTKKEEENVKKQKEEKKEEKEEKVKGEGKTSNEFKFELEGSEFDFEKYVPQTSLIRRYARKLGEYDLDFILAPNRTMKKFRKLYSNDHSYYDAIKMLVNVSKFLKLEPQYEKYSKKLLKRAGVRQTEYEKNEKTDKQVENWVEHKELKQSYKKVDDIKKKMVVLLYSRFIPRRNKDYTEMKYFNGGLKKALTLPKEFNYLVIRGCDFSFVYNNYKTAGKFGQQVAELNGCRFKSTFKKYIKSEGIKKGDYFFKNEDGTGYSSADWSNVVADAFREVYPNKRITSTMARHIFVSGINFNSMSVGEQKELAEKLGHSVDEMRLYWKK